MFPAFNNDATGMKPSGKQKVTLVRGPDATEGKGCIYLLAGNPSVIEFEAKLGKEVAEVIPNGAFRHFVRETAKNLQCEYVIVDVGPSCGALNRAILMTSVRQSTLT